VPRARTRPCFRSRFRCWPDRAQSRPCWCSSPLQPAIALIVTGIGMRLSTQMLRVIGTTGIHVVTRLFGILLAALAVQFVINGLAKTPLFH
jgi:small neutral amino acid transporter SnatA (MarC family)